MSESPSSSQDAVSPMRIAVVIESFDPRQGGNERSTREIVDRLTQRGHSVTLVCGCCDPSTIPEGVAHLSFSKRKPGSWLQLLRFRAWAMHELAVGAFDTSISMTMAVPAAVMQPRGGTVRETIERNIALRGSASAQQVKRLAVAINPKQRTLLSLERKTLQDPSVHAVAALSGYVKRQLTEHYGLHDDEIVVIPNGAAVEPVTDAERELLRGRVRRAFGVPDDATLFVFAAQNPRLKGFGPLIAAVRQLKEEGVPAVVLLAGRYRYTHLSWIAQMGVRDRVRMVGPTDEMRSLYAASDVTVLPTFYDPASKVVLESLMLGTPAISTRYNGASDFLTEAGGHYVGPPRGRVIDDPADHAALAQAMRELCDPEARSVCRAAMGEVAREVSMATHVAALEGLLRDASGRGEDT
ncbi:MAG: glycosyltransferase family 4 protein [Phycisphaerales bacterium JB063]